MKMAKIIFCIKDLFSIRNSIGWSFLTITFLAALVKNEIRQYFFILNPT